MTQLMEFRSNHHGSSSDLGQTTIKTGAGHLELAHEVFANRPDLYQINSAEVTYAGNFTVTQEFAVFSLNNLLTVFHNNPDKREAVVRLLTGELRMLNPLGFIHQQAFGARLWAQHVEALEESKKTKKSPRESKITFESMEKQVDSALEASNQLLVQVEFILFQLADNPEYRSFILSLGKQILELRLHSKEAKRLAQKRPIDGGHNPDLALALSEQLVEKLRVRDDLLTGGELRVVMPAIYFIEFFKIDAEKATKLALVARLELQQCVLVPIVQSLSEFSTEHLREAVLRAKECVAYYSYIVGAWIKWLEDPGQTLTGDYNHARELITIIKRLLKTITKSVETAENHLQLQKIDNS